ncbi:hypothetical protein Droror1_Dr00025091 [Drosera rotundifolia]
MHDQRLAGAGCHGEAVVVEAGDEAAVPVRIIERRAGESETIRHLDRVQRAARDGAEVRGRVSGMRCRAGAGLARHASGRRYIEGRGGCTGRVFAVAEDALERRAGEPYEVAAGVHVDR